MNKVGKLIDETLNEMEKREFTLGEVETFLNCLPRQVERNNQNIESKKPFKLFRFNED